MSTKNRKIWAAGVLLILTVAAAIGFLFRLSQPDQEQRSVYLNCTESDRGGWVFFTEAGPVEPVFGFGGYINGIPAEGTGPVAAERVMEESGARHFLQFDSYGAGLQVFLDHTLLYTDFPAEENPVDSFLEDVDPTSISHDGLRVPLPEDCGGKRLRIVTYGPSGDGLRPAGTALAGGTLFRRRGTDLRRRLGPWRAVTAQLLLAICLLLVLLLGAHDGEFLWKLLPLIGYFLLAAAAGVCHTYLEISAGLNADAGLLNWVYLIYMDLLYCYLAAALHGWKRWVLLSGALLHILLSALRSFAALPLLASAAGDWLGTALFLLAAALLLFSHEQPLRRTSLFLCSGGGRFICVLGRDPIQRKRDLLPLTNPVSHAAGGVSPCILRDPVRLCRCAVRRAGGDGLCARNTASPAPDAGDQKQQPGNAGKV